MAEVSVTFAVGNEQATVLLPVDLPNGVTPLIGDVSGTFGDCFIAGNLSLTGDLIVEAGELTGIDTFTVEGNGFQILFQNGGRPNLAGVEKSVWVRWDDPVVGWELGDRLAVAPTAPGVFVSSEGLWTGDWATMIRPPNSPDVILPTNPWLGVAKPEVVNLSQTIVLKNLRRIHFHDGAGVASLKWLKVLNCGTTGVLAEYPIHFHLCGETVRGSLVEGVVVEDGKNHAFVPHASHGVTFKDCAAVNTISHPFWWDAPTSKTHVANNTKDTVWDRCLVLGATSAPGRLAGFLLGAGTGNVIRDSVAVGVRAGADSSGFGWPESVNANIGGTVWVFENNVAHNNEGDGIFVWQNDDPLHVVRDFVAYRNGNTAIDHGAYVNQYHYIGGVLEGGLDATFKLHARPLYGKTILIEDVVFDGPLALWKHQSSGSDWITVRRCTIPQVKYRETTNGGVHSSRVRYEDSGLTPAEFDLAGIHANSIIEVYTDGVLTAKWDDGGWL